MGWLTDPLGYDFALRALAEVVVMGVSCGAIGAYVVVRRLAFIGDAISHAVFPGIVIAYLLGVSIVLGALVAGVVTALAIGWVARGGRIREDTAIGIFFAAAFALGIVLISTQQTYQGDLTGFLIGNLQGVSIEDLLVSAVTAALLLVALAALHKELLMVSFDRTLAAALGYPVYPLRPAPAAHAHRHDRGLDPGRRHHPRAGHAHHPGRHRAPAGGPIRTDGRARRRRSARWSGSSGITSRSTSGRRLARRSCCS